MIDKKNEIGKKIKYCREANQLSQSQLSQKLGVSQRNISYYENGERIPPADILLKLADIFKVSIDYILGNDNAIEKQIMYCSDITSRISDIAFHSSKSITDLKPLLKTEILSGYCTNLDLFLSDVYVIADFFGVSDEYIMGGLKFEQQNYGKLLEDPELCKFVSTFIALNDDNKDIIIGEMKKLLKTQKYEDSTRELQMAK